MKACVKHDTVVRFVKRAMLSFVLVGIAVSIYHLTLPWAFGVPNNSTNYFLFTGDFHRDSIAKAWQSRVLSFEMARFALESTDVLLPGGQLNPIAYVKVFAAYHGLWSLLSFIAVLFLTKSLSLTLTVYACSVSQWSETAVRYAFPWDWPSVFFLTAAFMGWNRKWPWLTVAACILGGFNKETVFVVSILYLLSRERRDVILGITILAGGISMKLLIIPQMVNGTSSLEFHLFENLPRLVGFNMNNPILACCGVLIASIIALPYNRRLFSIWFMIIVFLISQTVVGVVTEYRIYNEILPVCVYYIYSWGWSDSVQPEPSLLRHDVIRF